MSRPSNDNHDACPSGPNVVLSDDPIALPTLTYGYRTKPLDWDELVQIIRVENDLAKLCRSKTQQYEYEMRKRQLLREWQSMNDYVLCSKFGLEQKVDRATGLSHAYPPVSELAQSRTAMLRNDFPYCTAAGIEHWIYWKLGGNGIDEDELDRVKVDLRSRLEDVQDMLQWINPPHLKSLPEIDHVHILVRRGPAATTSDDC